MSSLDVNSLDDVYEHMRVFQQALLEFNQEVGASAAALTRSHEQLSGLWTDEAAVQYRQTYEPLARSLNEYLQASAPRFEHFLENKVRQLAQYLRRA